MGFKKNFSDPTNPELYMRPSFQLAIPPHIGLFLLTYRPEASGPTLLQ
jgi:hypothetical protein